MPQYREMSVSTSGDAVRTVALTSPRAWMSRIASHRGIAVSAAVLVLLAYLPVLLSAPGAVPGDTKLYLYLDPWRLISDSLWTWDNRQLGGWVPHQNVGYLWPTGPWFALGDALGLPDWVVHRLWLGTILVVAGLGTLWLARRLGLGVGAAFTAALAYQLTPYVLPYISRTSALLLPWSLLPWMCGLVVAIALRRRWGHIAIFAVLVFSSGGLNATALLMTAPGPFIWLVHLWRSGALTTRGFLRVTSGLAGVSLAVSAWWLVGLWVQGRYGAAVLSYSEALASTAATSSAPEVLRGLGYWLFYDRNDIVALTSASTPYQGNLLVMAAGAMVTLLGLWGIIGDRRWRWPLMTSVLVGTVLAVGAFPFDDPSPLWSFFADKPRHALSLALRSSSRAAPVVVLALALGVGSAVNRLGDVTARVRNRRLPLRALAMSAAIVLIGINLPALFGGRLIDPVMTRPNDVPETWSDAAAFLDDRYDQGFTGSVLLVPGIESAAYRWGYPVDPILPGLTKKPLISRDWLPLGSAPLMDLVYALDDAFQSGTVRAESIAPVARLLGADTVMVVNSHQYERFGTIRPERADHVLGDDPPGLRPLARFGTPTVNRAPDVDPTHPNWSEELVAHPHRLLPEIELYEVIEAAPLARTSTSPGIVAADGTSLVELAASGMVDGQQILIAEAALDDETLSRAITRAPEILVTDGNRRRAHHWRSSQDVWGATEPDTGVLLGDDLFDSRLPVFAHASSSSQTIVDSSSLSARASSYGPALTFHPENRPAMAIDGDPGTAWRTRTHGDPRGETLEITSTGDPIRRLRLVQPLDANPLRWITAVHVNADAAGWIPFALDDSSRTATGQIIELPEDASRVSVRIEAIAWSDPASASRGPGVGFAEVVDLDRTSPEVLVVPRRIQSLSDATPPTSFLFNRWRSDPFARWRTDPETTIERRFVTTQDSAFVPIVTARLQPHLPDTSIRHALGWQLENVPTGVPVGATGHLRGSDEWWGVAALDDDPSTVWWTASPLDVTAEPVPQISIPLQGQLSTLTMTQVLDPMASRVSDLSIEVRSKGERVARLDVAVPPPDATGTSQVTVPPIIGDQLIIGFETIEATMVRDEQSGLITEAPVGIVDITSDGWSPISVPESFDTGCRPGLVTIDGDLLSFRLRGSVDAILAGETVPAEICDTQTVELPAGEHRLSTSGGPFSGWSIDTVQLRDVRAVSSFDATAVDLSIDRGRRQMEDVPCPSSCWVEVADGWNPGWSATSSGTALSDPVASAGGRNLWFVDDTTVEESAPRTIMLSWTPQRATWWAMILTAVTLVVLIGLAVRERLTSRNGPLWSSEERFAGETEEQFDERPFVLSIVTAFIVGFLVISPLWALAAVALTGVVRRRPQLLVLWGWGLVALGFSFLVAQQVRTGAEPGFGWPEVFMRAHRPTLLGLVLLWIGVERSRSRPVGRDSV